MDNRCRYPSHQLVFVCWRDAAATSWVFRCICSLNHFTQRLHSQYSLTHSCLMLTCIPSYCFFITLVHLSIHLSMSSDVRKEYTNEFAVNLHRGSTDMDQVADQVAQQHGFLNRGRVSISILFVISNIINFFPFIPIQIGSLDGHYLFEHASLKAKSSDPANHQLQMLQKDQRVRYVCVTM